MQFHGQTVLMKLNHDVAISAPQLAVPARSSDTTRKSSVMRPTLVSLARRSSSNPTNHQNKNNNNNKPEHQLQTPQLSRNHNSTTPSAYRKPSNRPAFTPKDHNASIMNRVSHKGTSMVARSVNDATASMAYDKQKNGKPFAPALSTSAAKAASRTPLTPRVAGSSPALVPRRGLRTDQTSTPTTNQDLSTPISSFLSHNVTPRSGSRKSRIESPTSTPSGTPQGTPVPDARVLNHDGGLGAPGGDSRKLAPAFSPPSTDVGRHRSPSQIADDSKFFYASDAKAPPQVSRPPLRPNTSNKQSSTFLYANGTNLPPPVSLAASAVGSSVGEDRGQPKFFHANGAPDELPVPSLYSPAGSMVGASSTRLTQAPTSIASPPQRPVSPVKAAPSSACNNGKKSTLPSPGPTRPAMAGRRSNASNISTTQDTHRRKVSIEVPPWSAIHDSYTEHAPDLKEEPKRLSSGPLLLASMPTSPISTSSGRLSNQDGFFGDRERTSDVDRPLSMLSAGSDVYSPIKAGGSVDQMNELAAQARRERKVLDLEITNSSLESINRTLERQLRKQTAELRRYRRLSRSGRLSIVTATSERPSSGSLSAIGENDELVSDMSEAEDDEESEDSDLSDEPDEGTLSPAAIAANDAKHRQKDEKRLQLDLTKHQQLLIDSQKMNQSLKRCLGWTEELIREGNKALAYNVKASDVELGGRVLVADELEYDDEEEEEDNVEQRVRESMNAIDNVLEWDDEGKEDRDSGVGVEHQVQHRDSILGETY